MKTYSSNFRAVAVPFTLLVAAAMAYSPLARAQTTATTDPVGFVTASVVGGGSVSSPTLSLISPTLMQSIDWQGVITGVSGNTITVAGVQWTAGLYEGANGSHYVEIISTAIPAHTGAMFDIIASTATTTTSSITTSPLNGFAAIGDTVRIRKDVTIGAFFGVTNSAGLLASDDPSTADEVLIYDGASSTPYFYYTGGPGFPAGWYDSGFALAPGVATTVVIGPHQGVVIKRKAAGALSFTSSGTVKTGNTIFPVVTGLNVLGTVSAKGMTLDTSGLFTGSATTGVKPSDDPSTADEVIIYTGTSQANYFYYTGSPGFPAGWYDSGFSGTANAVVISPGTAFVVNRKGGANFNWALPSPTSF